MKIKTDDYKLFRAEVKKAMELKGWGYKDIEKRTGYSRNYVSRFMCGLYGSNDLIKAIAQVCEIEI